MRSLADLTRMSMREGAFTASSPPTTAPSPALPVPSSPSPAPPSPLSPKLARAAHALSSTAAPGTPSLPPNRPAHRPSSLAVASEYLGAVREECMPSASGMPSGPAALCTAGTCCGTRWRRIHASLSSLRTAAARSCEDGACACDDAPRVLEADSRSSCFLAAPGGLVGG